MYLIWSTSSKLTSLEGLFSSFILSCNAWLIRQQEQSVVYA